MSTTPTFYQIDLGQPMSAAHNTPSFWASRIGQIVKQTNGNLYIKEAQDVSRNALSAPHIWRLAFINWIPEDSVTPRLLAFGVDGRMLPEARFGVQFTGYGGPVVSGPFAYEPLNRAQYVPIDNTFMVNAATGYTVMVLDREHPSEALVLGWQVDPNNKNGHLVPQVGFQLFQRGANYPNDYRPE